LAPEHREVLLLRYFEGMAYEDIACVLGCQLGTVRSRIHYAKRALRRVMEGVHHNE
jgi:RNA polymerase sigma-70 factor (ECF subfamily)